MGPYIVNKTDLPFLGSKMGDIWRWLSYTSDYSSWEKWNKISIYWKDNSEVPSVTISIIEQDWWREIKNVQFSCSVVSDSFRPHESQHARPPCPSPTPKFTQTHVQRVSDAIQPSHLLSSPSPPAPNPSQHQSLFQWVNSSHEVAKVLEFQL